MCDFIFRPIVPNSYKNIYCDATTRIQSPVPVRLRDGNHYCKENSPTSISKRLSDSDLLGTTDGDSPLSITEQSLVGLGNSVMRNDRLLDSGNKAKQLLSASLMGVDLLSDGNFCGKENRPTDILDRPSDLDLLGTTDGESPLSTKDDCSIISDLSSCSFVSPEQKPSVQFEGNQVGEEYIDQIEVFSIEARPIDSQKNPFETDNLIERLLYYDSWSNVADADFSRLEMSERSGLFDDFLQHYLQYSSQRDFNLSYLLSAFSNLRPNKKSLNLVRLIENNDANAKTVYQEIQPYLSNEKLCFKTLLIGKVKVFEARKVHLEDRLIEYLYTKIYSQKKSADLISRMKEFKEMKTLIDLPQKRGYGEKPSFDFFNQFNYLKKKLAYELSGYFYEKKYIYSKEAHVPNFKGYSSLAEYKVALNQNTLRNQGLGY